MLYRAQMSRHRALAGEELAGTTDSQAHLSDIDRFAGETRDTGQLSEPLADSVLNYTLRRLDPDAKVDSRAVQELENSLYHDELSQMMEKDSTVPRQDLLAPMMRLEGHSHTAADQLNVGATRVPPAPGAWDRMGTVPMASLQSNGYNWWQLGLDSLQQPILPYDELFSSD